MQQCALPQVPRDAKSDHGAVISSSKALYLKPRGLLNAITVQAVCSNVFFIKSHGLLNPTGAQSLRSKVLYLKPHGLLHPIIVQSLRQLSATPSNAIYGLLQVIMVQSLQQLPSMSCDLQAITVQAEQLKKRPLVALDGLPRQPEKTAGNPAGGSISEVYQYISRVVSLIVMTPLLLCRI